MSSLNKVQLIGRLGKDPEMRFTPSGKNVTAFSMAMGSKWTGQDGQEHESTEWVNIEAWGRLGEICNQYLKKGRQVYIEGRLKTDKGEKDGITRYYTKVVANHMLMLGNKNDNGGNGSNYVPEPDGPEGEDSDSDLLPPDDDIPF